MTPRDAGFLLLTGFLGDPERKPLTVARFRELTQKVRRMEKPVQERELTLSDLQAIGCSTREGEQILNLLSQQEQLDWYLQKARETECYPITRASERYPTRLRTGLGLEAPGTLWCKGDASILDRPKISLVGSRELREQNAKFARQVGEQCAKQGYVLVSGHARGADKMAEEACLRHGGQVICVVSDPLANHSTEKNILFMAEDGFDIVFTPYRALSRNRIIHALGEKTFVAQCTYHKGGTWDGTGKNLRHGWSPVFCYRDESLASRELEDMGAILIAVDALRDISALQSPDLSFF